MNLSKTVRVHSLIKIILLLILSIISQLCYAEEPTEVFIGLRIDQITGINQKEENFEVVATLKMKWTEPRLAFTQNGNHSDYQIYTLPTFLKIMENKHIQWPSISYSNLRGKLILKIRL